MNADPGRDGEAVARALHLVDQVQAFGLASAVTVADRYADVVDRYLAQKPEPSPSLLASLGDTMLTETAEAMAGAWSRSFAAVAMAMARGSGLLDSSPHPETLALPSVRAGARTDALLWVHNPTADNARVIVRVGSLESADGHVLPSDAVTVNPSPVRVDGGRSAEVRVSIRVPPATPAGHYHALVTSTSTPRQAVPLQLEVLARGVTA